jgi:hypothetical protein
MLLMNTVQDDTMAVSGFQHQTFMCSSCHDVERRLVFAKQDEQPSVAREIGVTAQIGATEPTSAEVEPQYTAPSISPVVADQAERAPAGGVLRRVFGRLRGG